jgi:hypothetical protein
MAAKAYLVTFTRRRGDRQAKFVVLSTSPERAVREAWDSMSPASQGDYPIQSGRAEIMKPGAHRIL